MKLSEHLDTRCVILDLKSTTRDDAIRELTEQLRDNENIVDFDKYVADVFAREAEASTGLGRGAAIPHARSDALKDFVVAVGRSAEGIDFSSIDGEPAKIIVLMGTPKAKVRLYLKLLAHLSHLIKTNGFLGAVLDAPDADAVVEVFRSHER